MSFLPNGFEVVTSYHERHLAKWRRNDPDLYRRRAMLRINTGQISAPWGPPAVPSSGALGDVGAHVWTEYNCSVLADIAQVVPNCDKN